MAEEELAQQGVITFSKVRHFELHFPNFFARLKILQIAGACVIMICVTAQKRAQEEVMKKKMTTVPFSGTPEQEAKLRKELKEIAKLEGCAMPALQKAQEIYGYLPMEVQKIVAEETGIPLEKIFGITTFYSQFALAPNGKFPIGVCLGTACYVKGSQQVFDKISQALGIGSGDCTADGKFSLAATRCIGCCGLAPVMTVGEDVYGKVNPDEVGKILAKY